MGRALGAVAALGAWLALAPPAHAATASANDPGCGVMALAPRPGALTLALPHTFLLTDGDSVWSSRGAWRENTDYRLDRTRGELRLLREAMPGETLWVRACWLMRPPPLELQRYQYRPASARVDSAPPPAPPDARPGPVSRTDVPSGVSLALTGNKSLAVEFGSSQDAVLRQSLDLALTGTLAPGVQLTGVLTDRSTPVTATGSTLNLQEADQVRLELTAPGGGATLGDLSLRFDDGEFSRLERRLQGASGTWNTHGFQSVVAAASAAGEYQRLQFFGVDGLQGPYELTGRDGERGISVVAGSEIVTLDGARLARGESADYSIDYEAARIMFTNRHLITSASRITVDYQFTLQRYKRNFTAAGTRWDMGAVHGFARFLSESDDRGRPLGAALDASERLVLAASGDSTARAIGPGVTPGAGDYDSVRVTASRTAFAFAGPDSGHFVVSFTPVGLGHGDYADSALVSGRTVYRYVGAGQGSFVVGQALPLPEAHSLWAVGTGVKLGAARLDFEGAASRHDLNTFSSRDDGDNNGLAGRATLAFEGRPAALGGRGSLTLEARGVDSRFAPFQDLATPFEAEHWGLPVAADFEHSKRVTANAQWSPPLGGRLNADAGQLATPNGYSSRRAAFDWAHEGMLTTRALWERAISEQSTVADPSGGRDHARAEVLWAARWLAPSAHAEADERRFPSDTGGVGDRFRSAGLGLASGSAWSWHGAAGAEVRRDAQRTHTGFADQSESRSYSLSFDSPSGRPLSATLLGQRRDVVPIANPTHTRTDLASARLRGESAKRGLRGELDVELGSEGANRRTRTLTYAGPGLGAYDQFGNFVGHGDYNLALGVSSELERLAKTATHARGIWTFGASDAWRGSRAELTYEGDAQRTGAAEPSDVMLSPGAALTNPELTHGSVLQRFESDLAPQSRVAAFLVHVERRVTADRTYENFSQTTEDRQGSARWRTRPNHVLSNEVQFTLRRQSADQELAGLASASHEVETSAVSEQLVAVPDARLRAAAAGELSFARAPGQPEATRTLLVGPDLGLSVGKGGRIEVTARRAFVSGPPAIALLPSADPAGAPTWQGTARADVRLLQTFTLGLFTGFRQFEGRKAIVNGRLEMRAFF
jgi:hypothetical protein